MIAGLIRSHRFSVRRKIVRGHAAHRHHRPRAVAVAVALAISLSAVLSACSASGAQLQPPDAANPADAAPDAPSNPPQWRTRDLYSVPGNTETMYDGMVEGAGGALFAVGSYHDAAHNKHFFLRRSPDHGLSWASTGWDVAQASTDAMPVIAADSTGSLYIAGTYNKAWTVFKSTDPSGASFVVVDSVAQSQVGALFGSASLVVNAANEVFAVGSTLAGGVDSLRVRKSDSTGTSWTTVHDYAYAAGSSIFGFAIAIDDAGRLFIGAQTATLDTGSHVIVQRSADNGASWSTIEDLASPLPAQIEEVAVLRVLGTKLALVTTTRDSTTNLGELSILECDIATSCTPGGWTVADAQPIENHSPDDGIVDIGRDQTGTLWINGFLFQTSGLAFVARKQPPTGAWVDAHAEFGDPHVASYLRTADNRFFAAGFDFGAEIQASILEYR
jgi:hypothetical protein